MFFHIPYSPMLCQCPTLRQLPTFTEEVLPSPESPLICSSSLTNDLICSVTNSRSALIAYIQEKKSANCVNLFPMLFRIEKSSSKADSICPHDESSLPVWQIHLAILWNVIWNMIFRIWKKCQNMLRWSGQNANQKVGTDKMPTTEKSPDKMPTFGWHYVRLAFCPVGILSGWHFVLPPKIYQASQTYFASRQQKRVFCFCQ